MSESFEGRREPALEIPGEVGLDAEDDLAAWEAVRENGHPTLVVSSSDDDVSELEAEGFSSKVLRDPGGSAEKAFSVGRTPMAVRIDGEGRVASGVAAGSAAVLELLGASVPARGYASV